jgi:hypothetical protein
VHEISRIRAVPPATTPRHYFIVTPANAIAAGMFGGGGHGPDSTAAKAAPTEIGASLAKLCWASSISAGVICLFIFFSSSRVVLGCRNARKGRRNRMTMKATVKFDSLEDHSRCRAGVPAP